MAERANTRKPSPAPKNLSLKRGTENGKASIVASWGNPGDGLDKGNNHHYSGIDTTWTFKASKGMTKKVTQQRGDGHATGDVVWVRDKGIHDTVTVWYNRAKYHPRTLNRYLKSVTVDVSAFNVKGTAHTVATRNFQLPRAPTISVPEHDPQTGIITCEIKTNPGEDMYERYDTMYRIIRQDSANRNNKYKKAQVVRDWRSSTSESFEVSCDLSDESSLVYNQWVKVTFQAYSRGLAGNSKIVSRTYVYAFPPQATITEITRTGAADDGGSATGIVTIRIKTNTSANQPVDTVRLYRYVNTAVTSAASMGQIDLQYWDEVDGAEDNGSCTGFSDLVAEARPTAGLHTWYLVVSERHGILRRSVPVEAKCLYHKNDAATNDAVHFLSLTPNDTTSVSMKLAWNNDDTTTTEVSWSTHEDAWESTDQPDTFKLTWEDDMPATGYDHSANLTIRGLEEGVPVFVRARRSIEEGDLVTHGPWCFPAKELLPIIPSSTPSGPVLNAPSVVARGSGIALTWTFVGDKQTAWQVMSGTGSSLKEVASGNDTASSYTIPADVYGDDATIMLRVRVTSGGDWTESEVSTVAIADAPDVAVDVIGTLTVQPLSVRLTTTTPNASCVVRVVSEGTVTDGPLGTSVQTEGDIVWAGVVSASDWTEVVTEDSGETEPSSGDGTEPSSGDGTEPSSSDGTEPSSSDGNEPSTNDDAESNSGDEQGGGEQGDEGETSSDEEEVTQYTATITLPSEVDFRDGATYDVEATSTDPSTGLSSETAIATLVVTWGHQAVCPSSESTIEVDNELVRAAITPVAPENADQTDVCDIYRLTADGPYLIAEDVAFGSSMVDRFAPYSKTGENLAYRLCTRTVDGDIDFMDLEYSLKGEGLRVDFGDGSVTLPFNMAISDSFSKGFEAREHMDGSVAGYWDAGIARTASLSTDVVFYDAEQEALVRQLAKHAGPCFVRTPSGGAYAADVQVSGIDERHDSAAVGLTLTATEVRLTDEYRATPPSYGEPPEPEPQEQEAP